MKETKLSRCNKILLALVGVVLLGPVVDAQTNIYPQLNDLILGFRATGNPGQTLNLEVDLGPMSQFYSATPGQVIPLPGLSVLDLSATYGSNWINRTDLFWGAVATTGRNFGTPDGHAPTKTLWATAQDGTTPWNRASTFAQQGASATIEAMFTPLGPGALYGAVSTMNSTSAAVIDATGANSWGTLDTKNGISFGYFNPTIDNTMGTNVVVSQLYELQPTNTPGVAGTLLGNLVLTASGLSFQAVSSSDTTPPSLAIVQPTDYQGFTTNGITASGTAADASGIQSVTVNGVTAVGSNNWSLAVTLVQGTNALTVIATDASANHNTATQTVRAVYTPAPPPDTTPPSLTIAQPTDFQVFTNTGITASGTATDASGLQAVTVNGSAATVNGGTNWSLAVTLVQGTNTLTVIATDASANHNTATQTVHAVYAPAPPPDTTPPTITIEQPTDFQVFTNTGITASGTATDASGLQAVTVNGSAATVNGGTNWSLAVTLVQGTNTLTVIATDASANHNAATQTVHAVYNPAPPDTTPPTLAIVQPTDFQVFTNAGITASGTAVDASGLQAVTVNGSAATVSGGTNWSLAVTLVQGTNTLTVIATDASANHNTATQTVHAVYAPAPPPDTTPPSLTIAQPTDFQVFTNTGITASGTATDASGLQAVTVNGSAATVSGGTNWSLAVTLVQGTNTLAVIATDASANHNAATQTVHAVYAPAPPPDTTPPSLTIAQPTDFQVFTNTGITASGTATDASGLQAVTVNGSAATVSGGTNWSLAVTLVQGTNTLTVIATDASANHNAATQTVHAVYAPAPASRIIGVSGNLTFGNVVTGATATATLTITNAGSAVLTVTSITLPAGFSGAFSSPIAAGRSQGIPITFAPTALTNYGGIVTVNSDATGGTNTILASGTGIAAPPGLIVTTRSPLPSGIVGLVYNQTFAAINGPTPYQWKVVAGSLPAGLKLDAAGELSGTPKGAGTNDFTLQVTDASHLTAVADFTLVVLDVFGPLADTYNGLIIQTNVPTHASSGALTLKLAKTGEFVANITLGGGSTVFKGQFDANGNFNSNVVTPKGQTTVEVTMHLDVAGDTEQITGTVFGGSFTSLLLADKEQSYTRNNPSPYAGIYTCVFKPNNPNDPAFPQGYGYGTLTVNTAGSGSLKGVLGDGTSIKVKSPVSKFGTWPLYDALYKNAGSCIGWVTVDTNGTLSAAVDWFKPPVSKDDFYSGGFTTTVNLAGGLYVPPAAGSLAGNWMLTLGGGNLTGVITISIAVDATGKVTVVVPGVQMLTVKLTPKSGQFRGSFLHPLIGKPVKFGGLLLQFDNAGWGLFNGTNATGAVTIEPMP